MAAEPNAAVEAVRAKALASFARDPGARYAFASDPYTYARGKTPSVLIAIVTKRGSIVMAMSMADWLDPEELASTMMLEFAGCKPATAMEKALEAKAALPRI